MSPYFFLLVADVLQTLIKTDGQVRHPLADSPCTVLQYADDTLILLRGELKDVERLKLLLDLFSAATGLKINYDKSTAVLMHIPEHDLPAFLQVLGCRQEGFPQTYLGLPLSCSKLKLAAFDPYICKADRRLAGWQASLLNPMGRTVLINAVLDQLSYIMSAMPLLPGVISRFDKRRRGFLWTGDNNAKGSSCLVAWDTVRLPRDRGGLGIKDIGIQNSCLLLLLIHRLHTCAASSWSRWAREHACLASMEGDLHGHHWAALRQLLPIYQAVTTVSLGDGSTSSFWFNVWHEEDCLADRFPALLTHCKVANQSVRQIVSTGIRDHLVP
jgi:hypothetical protein